MATARMANADCGHASRHSALRMSLVEAALVSGDRPLTRPARAVDPLAEDLKTHKAWVMLDAPKPPQDALAPVIGSTAGPETPPEPHIAQAITQHTKFMQLQWALRSLGLIPNPRHTLVTAARLAEIQDAATYKLLQKAATKRARKAQRRLDEAKKQSTGGK